MKHIDRHKTDLDFVRKQFDRTAGGLVGYMEAAKADLPNLDVLLTESLKVVSSGCIAEPESEKLAPALRLAAQAASALFARKGAKDVNSVELGDELLPIASAPDPGSVTVYEWIKAFYLNVLCNRKDALDSLCGVSVEVLKSSATGNPDYRFLYMMAIRSWWNKSIDALEKQIIDAANATDPNRPDVHDKDWALFLDVPQIKVFWHMAAGQQSEFTAALVQAVDAHKAYWSSKRGKRFIDYRGFISIELTALAVLASYRGLTIELDSPYIPVQLVLTRLGVKHGLAL